MFDYVRNQVWDAPTIDKILHATDKQFKVNENGETVGIMGKYKNFDVETLTPNCLQVSGSIHKYWNNGTNENDFTFLDATQAFTRFCIELDIEPTQLHVKNLEVGVNLQLNINASEVLEQIICFNSLQPIRPYQNKPDCYFLEFELFDYFLKAYDKGKQYCNKLPGTPNTLRLEMKGRNTRFLNDGIPLTVADLMTTEKQQVLALKFAKIINGIVFDDNTVNTKLLSNSERKLYRELSNPRRWKEYRGKKTSTFRYRANRFKGLVETHGKRSIYSTIEKAVNDKIILLSGNRTLSDFLPNTYTLKTDKRRYWLSCNKDITSQDKRSKFCSAKHVGERAAKRCRNMDSNERNYLKTKIQRIESKGVLFPITPYIIRKRRTG